MGVGAFSSVYGHIKPQITGKVTVYKRAKLKRAMSFQGNRYDKIVIEYL